jgi:hypothetical protein
MSPCEALDQDHEEVLVRRSCEDPGEEVLEWRSCRRDPCNEDLAGALSKMCLYEDLVGSSPESFLDDLVRICRSPGMTAYKGPWRSGRAQVLVRRCCGDPREMVSEVVAWRSWSPGLRSWWVEVALLLVTTQVPAAAVPIVFYLIWFP